jgi:hypothetical protein
MPYFSDFSFAINQMFACFEIYTFAAPLLLIKATGSIKT